MKRLIVLFSIIAVVVASVLLQRNRASSAEVAPASVVSALSGEANEGFARATEPYNIEFPRDLGAHPEYQTEWWYYTGNLETSDEREFGFQFTIFRRAIEPLDSDQLSVSSDQSDWRTQQIYLVHFTVTDVDGEAFYHSERYARGGAGLAGAQSVPYRVWVEDWVIEERGEEVVISAEAADMHNGESYALNLALTQTLPPILHGEGGLSAKSLEPGNASYYYSQVQQRAVGTVQIGDEVFDVTGKAWKDHEYSTSVLEEGALGWDWFSLQFDDGTALMLFEIRREGGDKEPASSGTFVDKDGSTVDLSLEDWSLTVDKTWKSGETGGDYPVAWTVSIPKVGLEMTGQAKMNAQELMPSTGPYWEGAVDFAGSRDGVAVSAEGYVEMTGYAER